MWKLKCLTTIIPCGVSLIHSRYQLEGSLCWFVYSDRKESRPIQVDEFNSTHILKVSDVRWYRCYTETLVNFSTSTTPFIYLPQSTRGTCEFICSSVHPSQHHTLNNSLQLWWRITKCILQYMCISGRSRSSSYMGYISHMSKVNKLFMKSTVLSITSYNFEGGSPNSHHRFICWRPRPSSHMGCIEPRANELSMESTVLVIALYNFEVGFPNSYSRWIALMSRSSSSVSQVSLRSKAYEFLLNALSCE